MDLTIKIKQTNGSKLEKEITINKDSTIKDLKDLIESVYHIEPQRQNLIYKGHILFNTKKIEDYNINEGDTILLVEQFKPSTSVANSNLPNQPIHSGVGARGQINYDLLKQPISGRASFDQLEAMMSHPELACHLQSALNDPDILRAMAENPQIKPLLDMNPSLRDMMLNPEFMKSMFTLDNIKMMRSMYENAPQNELPLPGQGSTAFNYNNNIPNSNNANNNMMNPFMYGMNGMNMFYNNPFLMSNPFMFMNNMNRPQQQQQQPQLTFEQLKEKYKTQIEQIKEMGYDDEKKIIEALEKTSGSVEAAIENLFDNN